LLLQVSVSLVHHPAEHVPYKLTFFEYYNFKLIIHLFLDVMPFQSFKRM